MGNRIGLGLVALCTLVACASEAVSNGPGTSPNAIPEESGDDTSASTDPTDPSASDDTTNPEAPRAPLAVGLSVSEVAIYQGVKISVVKGGKWVASRNAPVVAGRPALVRVFVTPGSSFVAGEVTAELRLETATKKLPLIKDTKTIAASSKDEDTKSTFNFQVPAESLGSDVTFSVALTAKDGVDATGPSDARFPQDGTQKALGAKASGKVKIVVVPVKYDADGSGRVPDVSAAQLELYKNTVMARYPTTDVEISVHAPYSWTTTISGNGSGFSNVLRGITQLRQQDHAASDVYYYGALAPAASMSSFCKSGCVAGLSTVVSDPSTASMRASVGIGFAGDDSAKTMAHEVGHAHGREHAPCGGAQGVDPGFPYAGGKIGVWGYDIIGKTFMSPTNGTDMMGYCENVWVSDYTYAALFDRITTVSPTTSASSPGGSSNSGSARTFRVATVAHDGTLSWDGHLDLDDGDLASGIQVEGIQGARFFKFDHLPGGWLVLPKDAVLSPAAKLNVTPISAALTR